MAAMRRRELAVTSTSVDDAMIEIAVADRGPGLPKELTGQLFQPFVSTKRDGMGLGLLICRSIVEAHGGRVWVARRPGPGLTVQFTVPLGDGLQPQATRAGRSSGADSGTSSEHPTASAS